MTLPRLHNVPHVGVAQIDTDRASVCVVLPDDAPSVDIVVSAAEPQGRTMASATLDPAQAAGVRDALSDAIATMQGVDVQTVDVLVSDLQCAGGTMRLTAMASEPIAELTISCQTAQGWTTSWGEMNRQQLQALGAAVHEALETMPGELSDN